MSGGVIYTIGYGARSVDELIATLRLYGIEYLIDVRSQPYSRHKPEFSKSALDQAVREARLRYVFMAIRSAAGRKTPHITAVRK